MEESVLELWCAECGWQLTGYRTETGIDIIPCQKCLKEARYKGLCEGRKDREAFAKELLALASEEKA